MKFNRIIIILLAVAFTACGEYNKVLKSPDATVRYEAAKKYYEAGKYGRSIALLEEAVPVLRATSNHEPALYLLAQSCFANKDYTTASDYYKQYYTLFKQGSHAEDARYYAAYGLYLDSPDARLDQTDTYAAMAQFQDFLEYYPESNRKEIVQKVLYEMQDKLAYKELLAVKLYYNLGDYTMYPFPGANFTSAVITAKNAMQTYPYSVYREDFMYYIFKSKYEIAVRSVEEKQEFRYRDVVDEYYTYTNDFPQGKYLKEIQKLYDNINKKL
jgi:outer membrane protein assembly factor BamD